MVTIVQLLEAVNKVQVQRISTDDMVILAPVGTMVLLSRQECENSSAVPWLCAQSKPPRFNGVLVVEDEIITQVIVRSLVTGHRVEVG